MKSFSCGDVVPGCQRHFTADDENGILAAVAAHATADHGLAAVPPELVDQVRGSITD
jgi:predicted small metal-binding protein